jgi:HD-GYP domain-containing protein (c-di-GMP phosphodiesterase class II)
MSSDLHLETIEQVLKNVSDLLHVSFEIRDVRGEITDSKHKEEDEHRHLYQELYQTISAAQMPCMIKNPAGGVIWGIPIIANAHIAELFVVIHSTASCVIPLEDSEDSATLTHKVKETAEKAVISLVQEVLQLMSDRDVNEQELNDLAQELSIRYEELNFLYKIGGKMGAADDLTETLHYMMQKTTELIGVDCIAVHIPSKDIFEHFDTTLEKAASEPITQVLRSITPELMGKFNTGIDYLSDAELDGTGSLNSLFTKYRRLLTIPIVFDEHKEGIFFLGKIATDDVFSICDKRLINVVADMIAIKITNTELFQHLTDFLLNLMKSFMKTIEEKDSYTHGHSERVNETALKIGGALGLKEDELTQLKFVAILHDIGKIGISEDILNKPGKLNDDEFEKIKEHPIKGCSILEPIQQLKGLLPSILHHHEQVDGKGYPLGLSGTDIPLFARIIAVADTFDAMTSDRAYRQAKSLDDVVQELLDVRGKQLDPDITNIFISKCLGIKVEEDRIQEVRRNA